MQADQRRRHRQAAQQPGRGPAAQYGSRDTRLHLGERDTYESVTLEIGNPGTAINGTLPPPEPGFPEVGTPGPDGMRFLGTGMIEFPAGGRSNTVQVAVLNLLGEAADNAAIDLARKVGPQLPQ